MTRILIMGAGYVGLGHATLFIHNPANDVTIADIDLAKVEAINQGFSPLEEKGLVDIIAKRPKNLQAKIGSQIEYTDFDVIFLCLPTNYDDEKNQFDTHILDSVLADITQQVVNVPIVIKSTLPIGYTQSKIDELDYPALIFSPEFLREGQALQDNLNPSRLVIGTVLSNVQNLISLYLDVVERPDVPVLTMSPTEAESVKLFANTYLAMRVAFFNELDTFSEVHGINSAAIIKGVGLDERIGRFYNNPSFGYGGYCLPKDSKQLRSNFEGIPGDLIGAIVTSNDSRKQFIVNRILATGAKVIGIYKLSMKQSSDNSRESAVLDIITNLKQHGREIMIFEPHLKISHLYSDIHMTSDFDVFAKECDLILANRWEEQLTSVTDKVYTRDIFQMD